MKIIVRTRAMTMIEALVVLALGTIVFGLILNTLVVTQRESDRLTSAELMHQEALLISQTIERTLRFRVAPAELENALAGGAGPEASASGGSAVSTSTLPASIAAVTTTTFAVHSAATTSTAVTSVTAVKAAEATSPDRVPASQASEFTSAPASIQSILGTTNTASSIPISSVTPSAAVSPAVSKRPTAGQERFAADEIVVYSLGSGPDPGRLVFALRNSRGIGTSPSHSFLEQSPAGSAFAPGSRRRSLGPNADKFQSQISFRYASSFDGTKARWTRESRDVPRLVEYTVRVWPVGSGDSFEQAQQSNKPTQVFQLTSAMSL